MKQESFPIKTAESKKALDQSLFGHPTAVPKAYQFIKEMNLESVVVPDYEGEMDDLVASMFDMYLTTHSENELENAMQALSGNDTFKKQLQAEPKLLFDILDILYRPNVLADKKALDIFVLNTINCIRENEAAELRLKKRVEENPIATVEELLLGTYYESLESQVMDATRILRGKGYNTFESGYGDRLKAEQMVGFDTANKPLPEIPTSLENYLKEKNIGIRTKDGRDRYQIILTPLAEIPTVAEWGPIWKDVAEQMPAFDNHSAPRNIWTPNARDFYDEQMEMSKGTQ